MSIKVGDRVGFVTNDPVNGGQKRVLALVEQDLGDGYFAVKGINPGTRRASRDAGAYRMHESRMHKVSQ